jgi:hypothetical protein
MTKRLVSLVALCLALAFGYIPASSQDASYAFPVLTNTSYPRVVATNLGVGDVDLYTAPAGRRAIIGTQHFWNPTAGTISLYLEVKDGSTYRRISDVATAPTLYGANLSYYAWWVLDAGDSLAVHASAAGLSFFGNIVEFDESVGLRTVCVSLGIGNNTLYTVPSGRSAHVLPISPTTSAATSLGNIGIINDSGAARTITLYYTPNGGSAIQASYGGSVPNGGWKLDFATATTMQAGDSIVVNSDSGAAGQMAYLIVVERRACN